MTFAKSQRQKSHFKDMQKQIEEMAPDNSTHDQEHGIGSSFDPQSGPTEEANGLIEQLDGEGVIRKTPTTPDSNSSPNRGLLEENLIES